MAESKTSTIAVVTLTMSVELSQPRGGECTLAQIQARRDATERLAMAATALRDQGMRVGEVRAIRIVLNEEPVE